ncbi:MAG: hypothetical protein JSW71_15030 [Gemmatimonadota bacterium]|nr:MAG: hypothetical protein JSW71_15030 [Gemmatimonadota bacterium]
MDSVAHLLVELVQAALRPQETSHFLQEAATVISRWAGSIPVSIEYRIGEKRNSATSGPAPREGEIPQTASWTDRETGTSITAQLCWASDPAPRPTINAILAVANALAALLERCRGVERPSTIAKSIVEASPWPTALIDSDGRVLIANRAFVALTGVAADWTEAGSPPLLAPALVEAEPLVHALELAAHGARWEGGVTVCHQENRRSCEAVVTKIVGQHPDRLLLTLHDRTDQLRVQREAIAREKLATAGEIASGVAHEVNNPLAAIRIEAELLAGSTADPETADSARVIIREVDRASHIAKTLIHLTRRSDRELHGVQVNDLLQEVLDLRSQLDNWRRIDLRRELDPALPPVIGPIADLRQVFFNLVVNAEDAVQGAAEAVIEVRSELAGSAVRISISDSGPGVPVELHQRIFDPFFTTKDPDKGSGLGLSLSNSVVAELGGKIWVEDSPLGGARFVIELAHGQGQ